MTRCNTVLTCSYFNVCYSIVALNGLYMYEEGEAMTGIVNEKTVILESFEAYSFLMQFNEPKSPFIPKLRTEATLNITKPQNNENKLTILGTKFNQ